MGVLGVPDWLGHFPSPQLFQIGTTEADYWVWLLQHVKTLKLPSILCTILVKVRDILVDLSVGAFLGNKKVGYFCCCYFLNHISWEKSALGRESRLKTSRYFH